MAPKMHATDLNGQSKDDWPAAREWKWRVTRKSQRDIYVVMGGLFEKKGRIWNSRRQKVGRTVNWRVLISVEITSGKYNEKLQIYKAYEEHTCGDSIR